MATCAYCGVTILFGGVRATDDPSVRFCSAYCYDELTLEFIAQEIPTEIVQAEAEWVLQKACPSCGRVDGDLDVYSINTVTSMLMVTWRKTRQQISCQRCGQRAKKWAIFRCLCLGWWSLPLGPIFTVGQIRENIAGMQGSDAGTSTPSRALQDQVRLELAAEMRLMHLAASEVGHFREAEDAGAAKMDGSVDSA